MSSTKRNANVHRGRHVIRYYSKGEGCTLTLESFIELWLACKLENDPNVLRFASQPESIELEINGKRRRLTPDFLVEYSDGFSEYIEIHHERWMTDEFNEKIRAFSKYTKKTTGRPIRLISPSELNELELVNFQLIADSANKALGFDVCDAELPELTTFSDLISCLEMYVAEPISEAYTLLSHNLYQFDTNAFLTNNTTLHRSY